MAYDYNKSKKLYEQMNAQQQQQFAQQNKNDPNYQQFMNDYTNDANRVNKVSTPAVTSPYQNQGTGNYSYNPNSQYYEKTNKNYQNQGEGNYTYNPVSGYYENNSKPQTNQYTDYSKSNNTNSNNSDFYGQNNQYQGNASTINTLGNMATDIYNQGNKGYSDLMGGSNYATNFDDAVNNKLKSAFGLNNLNELKNKYPEQYESVVQALESVRGVRDATDPTQRQMLDGYLQGIIGSGVGAGSDMSKLNVLNQTLMDKFKNGEQVAEDMRNIVKLQTEGMSTSEIASKMGISEDQVQQAILAYNGLDNKLGEYYQLKSGVASDITEPYDKQLARLDEEKKIALERANRQVDWLKQDFDTSLERQKQQNDINAHNADAIAGRTGLAFSKRGIEGLNYVAEQARQIIDDITKNYDRNNQNLADGVADIIRKWQRNNEDLMKASQDALTAAKNNFTSNMLAVQQQYGTVGLQAQQALANNVQGFIEQAQNIYDNALVRQQQNLTNLINNVSNINALEAQNLTMRNAKIQQFQAESMNLNRNQLQGLAQQLGMDTGSYQDLVNYQAQAVANELNGYLPGAGVQFQSQIQSLLDQGYTPQQAMQSIMNSADFKAMQQATTGSADKWSMSGGILYNQATGEYTDLNGDEYGTIGDKLYNKRTGEIISGNGGNGLYQFTESEVRTGDTIGNDINSIGHILQSEDGIRIGTYKSSNGYTYNVYANREDGIKATENLLKRGYYGMTLGDAAQKWIGKGKDISAAKKVIQSKGLSLDAKLSDENVRKFIEAMGTWEGTLKKGQTLDDWANGGRNLGNGTNQNTQADGPLTDYGVPIPYDRSIKALIPTQLMNSELELKKLESNIESLYKAGYSAEDAVLQYMGFNINKPEDKDIALNLVNAVRSLTNEDNVQSAVSYISQRINAGDYNGAITKVENLVRQEAKKNEGEGYFDESTAIATIKKANELIELANSLPEDIGVFQGSVQKYLKKLKSSDASKLQTAIANLTDKQVLRQAGSNVTDGEMERIKTRVPQLDDRTDTFMNKIQQMKENALADVNAWRQTYGLPILDETSLLDRSSRVNLYMGGGALGGDSDNGSTVFKGSFDLSKYGRTGK